MGFSKNFLGYCSSSYQWSLIGCQHLAEQVAVSLQILFYFVRDWLVNGQRLLTRHSASVVTTHDWLLSGWRSKDNFPWMNIDCREINIVHHHRSKVHCRRHYWSAKIQILFYILSQTPNIFFSCVNNENFVAA